MTNTNILPKFTIKQLLQAGVHFGHKTMRRNPKMAKYVHSNRNGLSIIDLNKTAKKLHESLIVAHQIAKNNGRILFVGTKRQASPIISEMANKCGQYYVNFRWLGGMLTNWKTVSKSIKTLRNIEEQLNNPEVDYSKKEKLVLERNRQKLEKALGGIKNMGGYPDLIVIIDIKKEEIAIQEALKLNIPIMAVVDTNCSPDNIKYVIPGNDDSSKAIKLYCGLLSDAIISGIRENMIASGVDISKFDASQIQKNSGIIKKDDEKKKPEAKKELKEVKEDAIKSKKKVIIAKDLTEDKKEEKEVKKKPVKAKKTESSKTEKKAK